MQKIWAQPSKQVDALPLLRCTFSLASLIPIWTYGLRSSRPSSGSRVQAKQFFLLLSWFLFLGYKGGTARVRVATLPTRVSRFTVTRAPIAHKTWSKEQYQFTLFRVSIRFEKPQNSLISSTRALWLLNQMSTSYTGGGSNLIFFRFMKAKLPLLSLSLLSRRG
jgi:hypothetical protein